MSVRMSETLHHVEFCEERYGIPSWDIHDAIEEGRLVETQDVCDWIMDYDLVRRWTATPGKESDMKLRDIVRVERDTYWSQAKGCWGYIQIRYTSIFIGQKKDPTRGGWRLFILAHQQPFSFDRSGRKWRGT